MADIDLYEVLGVTKTASTVEIKKAYHKAALSSHPDKVPIEEREEAEIRFKGIKHAYEILYDEDKRASYDRFGMAAFEKGNGMGGMDDDGSDLDDFLAQMFMNGMGGMGGMPGGMPQRPGADGRKAKGKDAVQEYEVTLEDMYKGKTVKLASTRNKLCASCSGTGGKDKTKPKKCGACGGAGYKPAIRRMGPMIAQETVPCAACKASGEVFREKDRCRKCKGNCVVEEKKVLELYIPRGAVEGDKITLEGEADEEPNTETGNIVFVLEEKEHKTFVREGADLTCPMTISLAEALTGFERVVVKHLDGRGISVKHPQGQVLKHGQILKVVGEGMPHKRGEGKGNLFLVVNIEFPEEGWTPDVEMLRKLLPERRAEDVTGEPVDEVEYVEGNIEEFGGHSEEWEDEDDSEDEAGDGPQCAQQ